MPVQTTIQMRQGTAAQWTTANPILANGENGYETDTKKFKIGDGSSTWSALDYFTSSSNTLTQYGSTTSTRTNLIANPNFETGTTGWAGTATLSRVTTDFYYGTASLQVAASASSQNASTFYASISPSTTYTFSAWVKGEIGKTISLDFRTYSDAGVTIISTKTTNAIATVGSWQRYSFTITTESNALNYQVIIRNQYAGAHTFYVDGVLVETGLNLQPYFDGASTSSRNVAYAWTGTANNSTSTETRTIGTGASADFIYTNSVQSNTQQLLVGGVDYDLMRLQGQNQDRTFIETIPRMIATASTLPSNSGYIFHTFFTAPTTITVSTIQMLTGGTAGATLTLARMGLYTFDGTTAKLVAQTASDTTLFTATYTLYTRSFDTTGGYPATYTLQAGQRYGIATIVTGTTMPSFAGCYPNAATTNLPPRISSVFTGQTDLVASQTTFNTSGQMYWGRLA
jgi:hypothetical protein